jgi:5-methylcytosine-specific restriction endonuclease McrA
MFKFFRKLLCCFPKQEESVLVTAKIAPAVKHRKDRIPKKVRDAVWSKYHGDNNVGNCYCCNKEVQRYKAGWHCSHVIADSRGGEEKVDNLRVCCRYCNLSMGNQNLYCYIVEKKLPRMAEAIAYLEQHPDQKDSKRSKYYMK